MGQNFQVSLNLKSNWQQTLTLKRSKDRQYIFDSRTQLTLQGTLFLLKMSLLMGTLASDLHYYFRKKKVGKAPNCYVGISPKGKNVKFFLVTLHVGKSPKFWVKLEYLRKGKNILFMSLTLHVGTSPNCDMTLLT